MDGDVSISLLSAEHDIAAGTDDPVVRGRRNERRSLAACEWCCKQKAKCSGSSASGEGCNACLKRGIPCIFMPKMKRGRKKRKVATDNGDDATAHGLADHDASSPSNSSAGRGIESESHDPLGDLSLLASQTPYATQDDTDHFYTTSFTTNTTIPVSALQVYPQPADFNISTHSYPHQPQVALTDGGLRPSPTLSHYALLPDTVQAKRPDHRAPTFSLSDFTHLPPMQPTQVQPAQTMHRIPSLPSQSQIKDIPNTSPASRCALSVDDRANLATALYKPQGAGVGHFSDIVSERTAAVDGRADPASAFLTNCDTANHADFAEITDPKAIQELEALSDLPSTQRSLRSIFWAFIHPQWPIIFRPTWEMDEVVEDHPALRWAMLCLACRFDVSRQLRDVSTHLKNLPLAAHLGQVYYDRAIKSLNMLQSSLQTAQAMYFLSLRDAGQGATSSAWLLSGLCIRMVYDLKLHSRAREGDGDQLLDQKKSRFVWACFVMDKSLSIFLGRPSMTHYAEIETMRPPLMVADEFQYWAQDCRLLMPDRAHLFRNTKTHTMSTLNAWVDLMAVFERIMSEVYSQRTRNAAAVFNELNNALNEWPAAHPDIMLRAQCLNSATTNLFTVLLWHQTGIILLNRPFIPTNQQSTVNNTTKTAYSLCIEAADQIVSYVTTLENVHGIFRCSYIVSFFIFHAGIVNCLAAATSKEPAVSKRARNNLHLCINWLDQLTRTYRTTVQYRQVLEGMERLMQGELREDVDVNNIMASRRVSRAPSPNQNDGLGEQSLLFDNGMDELRGIHHSFFDMPLSMPLQGNDFNNWADWSADYNLLIAS